MNISDIFEKGVQSKTYRRIDSRYRTDIFLGYNDNGQMSMVIIEFGKEQKINSSKVIDVSLRRRDDKRLALCFDLTDNTYKELFYVFCKDIILACEREKNKNAISMAITRWKYWKEMFGNRKQNVLDRITTKGLIGELFFLKNYLIPTFGEEKAIASWLGPLLGHKDFEIDNTWYEVKCISENAIQVIISSLEQLESEVEGHLVIIRLEDTSTVNTMSINLNSIVASISDMIKDPDALAVFFSRLDNVGYGYNSEYNNYNYIFKGEEKYVVNDKFPRLQRKDIPVSIGNVKYTILLNGLTMFKER